MKRVYIIACAVMVFVATGCEKEVVLNTKKSEPRLVIQANFPVEGYANVEITKSIGFNDLNLFPAVSNAQVEIWHGTSKEVLVRQGESGKYKGSVIKAQQGETYTLIVVVDGEPYVSVQTAPKRVRLGGFRVDNVKEVFSDKYKLLPVPLFQDPIEYKNFYKFNYEIQGRSNRELIVFNDANFNGQIRDKAQRLDNDSEIRPGDNVRVEMQCITESVWRFYFELQQAQSAVNKSPANPTSNISGGALGYFSVYTTESMEVIAPEFYVE